MTYSTLFGSFTVNQWWQWVSHQHGWLDLNTFLLTTTQIKQFISWMTFMTEAVNLLRQQSRVLGNKTLGITSFKPFTGGKWSPFKHRKPKKVARKSTPGIWRRGLQKQGRAGQKPRKNCGNLGGSRARKNPAKRRIPKEKLFGKKGPLGGPPNFSREFLEGLFPVLKREPFVCDTKVFFQRAPLSIGDPNKTLVVSPADSIKNASSSV